MFLADKLPMKQNSSISNITNIRKWYYDACVLDESKNTYYEIINKNPKFSITSITSHLGLGEAYGNCRKKGEEQAEAFISLINKLGNRLDIVGNDDIEKELIRILEVFPALSITDAIHLATAIRCKCEILRTIDPDLHRLPHKKVRKLAEEFGCPGFAISLME